MQIVIEIPKELYIACEKLCKTHHLSRVEDAIGKGIPLPERHGRLIDADKTLAIAWHKFWKQEEEHEKTIEGYDILRDRFYEQEGFECCQQTIVNAETIIPATQEKSCATCGQPRDYADQCILFKEGKCVERYEKWKPATKEGDGE